MGFLFFAARIDLVAVKALDCAEIVMARFNGQIAERACVR